MSNRSSVDERASAPSEASRRGAHRARPKAVPSALPIIAGAAVILLVIGGAYFGLRDTSLESKGTVSAADADVPSASPTAGTSASPSASASATGAAGSTPSASATRSATTTVTKNVKLAVLNSISVQGLAARAQSTLENKGWTVTRTGNSTEKNLAISKVYYGRPGLRATARQIVRDLGAGSAVLSPTTTEGMNIIVVLGQDAQ